MFGKKSDIQADLELFTIFDSLTKSYEAPLLAPNKDVLLRDILNNFKKSESQKENKYYINAECYSIFRVGSFDKKQGDLSSYKPEWVANLHDIRALVEPQPGPMALSPT